jgi:ribosomal protein S13
MKNSIAFFFMQTYGISSSLALKMCSLINVAPQKNHDEISDLKKKKAFQIIPNISRKTIELKTLMHYDRINNIKAFKLRSFLPINGQRNKRNARTAKKFAKVIGNLKQTNEKKKNGKK